MQLEEAKSEPERYRGFFRSRCLPCWSSVPYSSVMLLDTRQIAIELRHKQTKNQIEVEDLEQMELVPERQSVEEDGHKVIRDTTAAHGDCTIPSSQGSSGEEQHGKGGYSTSQGYGTMEHPGMMPETQNEMPTPDIPTGSNSESHGHAVAPPSDLIGPAGHAGEDWAAIVRELEVSPQPDTRAKVTLSGVPGRMQEGLSHMRSNSWQQRLVVQWAASLVDTLDWAYWDGHVGDGWRKKKCMGPHRHKQQGAMQNHLSM